MYGKVVETPQKETTPFHPRSPYGCAKVFSYWQTVNYRESYGIYACNGILFNHESPARRNVRDAQDHPRRRRASRRACRTSCSLGNLDAKRDWGFAGDYVEAMWMMLQQQQADDYVIATGETHPCAEFLDECFALLDLDWKKYVEVDPRYFRPAEVDLLLGDASKARKAMGWKPKVTFKGLVKMMIDSDWEIARREKLIRRAGEKAYSMNPSPSDQAFSSPAAPGSSGSLSWRCCRARLQRITVPRRKEYDLRREDVERLSPRSSPDVVLHLAAEVGGIGANRHNPGRFFYANAVMGIQLIEGARKNNVKKFVQVGTICAYPNFTPVPFQERTFGTAIRKRPTRPMAWRRSGCWSCARPIASNMGWMPSTCCRSISMARATTSIRNHPT